MGRNRFSLLRRSLAVLASSLCVAGCASTDPAPWHRVDPASLGPYSGSVRADDFVFVSGKIASAEFRSGTIRDETASAIDAVERELREHDLGLGSVVSVTVFLTSMDDFAAFNEVYASRFPSPYPARAIAGVASLPGGAHVELSVIATSPD